MIPESLATLVPLIAPGLFATPLGRVFVAALFLVAVIVIVKLIASFAWRILSIGLLVFAVFLLMNSL